MTVDRKRLRELAMAATPLPGYSVDSDGNVWSDSNWRGYGRRKLTTFPNAHGYPAVKVRDGGRMRKALVHKMVCEAFHGPKPSPSHEVRHLDGNRSNNRAENLCWGTRVENAADRKAHGTERSADNGRRSAEKLRGRGRREGARGEAAAADIRGCRP